MAETTATRTPIEPPPAPAAPGAEAVPDRSTPPASLRSRLRRETRAAHERLDASFIGLSEGDPADYGLFLRMNEACHGTIEPVLAASPLAALWPPRVPGPHAAALADMEAIGLRPIVPAPFPVARPSLAQAVGIAYVLEGSKLGARQILKKLAKDDPAATDRPPTAFLSHVAGSAEGFRGFLDLIEDLVADSFERDAAVGAADATFGYFLDAVRRARADGEGGGEVN